MFIALRQPALGSLYQQINSRLIAPCRLHRRHLEDKELLKREQLEQAIGGPLRVSQVSWVSAVCVRPTRLGCIADFVPPLFRFSRLTVPPPHLADE